MPRGLAVVQAALMVESGSYTLYDRIVIATCPPAVQLERLMKRDGLSESQAMERIRSQMSQEEKARYAHHVVDTRGGFESVRTRTAEVFRELQKGVERNRGSAV
jgi:dephospho-CoA kinase